MYLEASQFTQHFLFFSLTFSLSILWEQPGPPIPLEGISLYAKVQVGFIVTVVRISPLLPKSCLCSNRINYIKVTTSLFRATEQTSRLSGLYLLPSRKFRMKWSRPRLLYRMRLISTRWAFRSDLSETWNAYGRPDWLCSFGWIAPLSTHNICICGVIIVYAAPSLCRYIFSYSRIAYNCIVMSYNCLLESVLVGMSYCLFVVAVQNNKEYLERTQTDIESNMKVSMTLMCFVLSMTFSSWDKHFYKQAFIPKGHNVLSQRIWCVLLPQVPAVGSIEVVCGYLMNVQELIQNSPFLKARLMGT